MDQKGNRVRHNRILSEMDSLMCLRDDKLKGSQVCIITGPRIDLAITLIKRLKGLFPDIVFDAQRGLPSLYSTKT
jgi:hypothetical protein